MVDTASQINLVESAVGTIKNIAPYLMTFGTSILIIWAILRARSAHFLIDKIWRIVGGGAINDPDLKKEWHVIRDMEAFRFRSGIKFNTKSTWSHTLRWLEHNDLSLSDLTFARAWIDGKPWDVKAPWIRCIRAYVLLVFIVLGPLVTGMVYAFTSPSVLLTIKVSRVTFWSDGFVAKDFELDRKTPDFSVDSETCRTEPIEGISEKDRDIICSSLETSSMSEIEKALRLQKFYSGYVAILCFIGLFLAARYLARARMAMVFSDLKGPRIT